jgi:hypothetical protein
VWAESRSAHPFFLPKVKLQSNTPQLVSPMQWRAIEAGIYGVTGIWGWGTEA